MSRIPLAVLGRNTTWLLLLPTPAGQVHDNLSYFFPFHDELSMSFELLEYACSVICMFVRLEKADTVVDRAMRRLHRPGTP